jgi:uncharacterized protein (TIGR03085 family)
VTDLAASERAALSDLLDRLGPEAPTLCDGWTTRDLAAHVIVRESRPDAAAGIVIPFLSAWTKRVQDKLARGDFLRLVNRVRHGPPAWSPFRFRGIGESASNIELFVHHEDVRRAQPGWKPRVLDPDTEELLWQRGRRIARLLLRSVPAGVELVRSDTGERLTARAARAGQGVLTLTGTPQELLMYMHGRYSHALIERAGEPKVLEVLEHR